MHRQQLCDWKPKDAREETHFCRFGPRRRMHPDVFEPVFDEKQPDSMLKEGEHKYDLTFGGEKCVLYQHSCLGYGLKQAREHVHKLVDFLAPEHKDPSKKRVIANPCLASGTKDDVKIGEGEDQKTLNGWC